jgi:putative flippase GtrA
MKQKIESAKIKLRSHKDKFMYLGVGILAFIVDAGIFSLARKLNLSIGASNIIGMVSGMITSFSLNWRVVFKNKQYSKQFHHMVAIFIILNIFNWWFSTNFIKITSPLITSLVESILNLNLSASISEFFAKIGSIAVIICWNFILYKKVIFKEA